MNMQSRYDLNKIIDMEKWQKLQDSLSLTTKMAIITVDYRGNPVTKHSKCQAFCQAVRQDPLLSSYCQKCDARGGLEAVRLNEPYIYKCHFQIMDIAIPIVVDNQYIGAIMAGQIKIKEEDPYFEQIVTRPSNTKVEETFQSLKGKYEELPILSYEEVKTVSEMLFHLCSYIVEEAIHKNLTVETYKRIISAGIDGKESVGKEGLNYKHIHAVQHELASTLVDNKVKRFSMNEMNAEHSILQPAFDYIFQHKGENVTLKKMAKLCHISPSYFSRIFLKETGENFSVFVPRLKVEWAKQLLETTDLSVNEISYELGFYDSGYFIKVFKRLENVTPAAYRKYYS